MNQKTTKRVYDLEERTSTFSLNLIKVCKQASKNAVSEPILNQLIRAGTSIGANYAEANGASSRRDFKNKIFICKKEAKETMYWLRLLAESDSNLKDSLKPLWTEAHELAMIFSKIALKTN